MKNNNDGNGEDNAPGTNKTLEMLVAHLKGRGMKDIEQIDDRIYAAMLLAFDEAATIMVNSAATPTPLFSFDYDEANHKIEFASLKGHAGVPHNGTQNIDATELLIAATLRDRMNLLWEGDTGTGKTLSTKAYMAAVLPSENYMQIRLSSGFGGANIYDPYTKMVESNGEYKQVIDMRAVRDIVMYFIDEINRGDTNETIAISDSRIELVNGQGADIGTPIPKIEKDGRAVYDKDDLKRLFVVGAQNPSDDPTMTGVNPNDGAVKNRYLNIRFPNIASSAGSAIMLKTKPKNLHKKFRELFNERLGKYLGISVEELKKNQDEDWLGMYAYITNPARTEKYVLNSSLEFTDFCQMFMSRELLGLFDLDKKDLEAISAAVAKPTNFQLTVASDTPVMNNIKNLTQNDFDRGVVPREITKIREIADLVATNRVLDQSITTADPVGAYLSKPNYITARDVSAAVALIATNKMKPGSKSDPIGIINEVLKQYVELSNAFYSAIGRKNKDGRLEKFNPDSQNDGIKYNACMIAYSSALGKKNPTHEDIVDSLYASIEKIKGISGGNDIRKMMIARVCADLAAFAYFVKDYKDEVDKALSETKSKHSGAGALINLYRMMRGLRDDAEKTKHFHDVQMYSHRLERVLG